SSAARDHAAPPSCPTRRSSDLEADRRRIALAEGSRHRRVHGHVNSQTLGRKQLAVRRKGQRDVPRAVVLNDDQVGELVSRVGLEDRKSTRLNSSHVKTSYAVFC